MDQVWPEYRTEWSICGRRLSLMSLLSSLLSSSSSLLPLTEINVVQSLYVRDELNCCWLQDGGSSLSAEICVVQDLLQNHRELFHVRNTILERGRRLLAEQHKLHDMVCHLMTAH